jgi:hypothetical protein
LYSLKLLTYYSYFIPVIYIEFVKDIYKKNIKGSYLIYILRYFLKIKKNMYLLVN